MRVRCLDLDTGYRFVPNHGQGARVMLKRIRVRKGFLLMEAMIASVILAVAAVGIADMLLSNQQEQLALQENSTAVLLARQLMEEIASYPFGNAAPPQLTYANQYNNYSDTTNAITTLAGETISPGGDGVYLRSVSIGPAAIPSGSAAPQSDLQVVTVTVITPDKQTVTLSRMLTNVTWP